MRTTFGAPMSLGEDAWMTQALALGAWPSQGRGVAGLAAAIERDVAITDARWRGAARTVSGEFVPGDCVRLRALGATWLLDLAASDWHDMSGRSARRRDNERELALIELLLAAVPYFLPAASALGVMASQPPEPSLLAEIRLPYPAVAVFFSAPFEIPERLRGGEEQLADRLAPQRSGRDVLLGAQPQPDEGPNTIRFATLSAYRGKPLSVVGVVLTAGLDGSLGEPVAFLLAEPVAPKTAIHVVEGRLTHTHLEPLLLNLAAAVAWGAWHPPERRLDLPPDPRSRAFRDAVRRGVFRRLEPRGAAAGVRVLDAARMARPASDGSGGGGHPSPATHLRRGHWQRYRVGPKSDWHYEPRWVPPVVVNPSGRSNAAISVFRLPLPPEA